MDRRHDPRTIVTPYAFSVHPDLVGRPLATPWQRLAAILIDLVVIGILALLGAGPLAIASVILLAWLAFRKPGQEVIGKVFRIAAGCLASAILLVIVVVALLVRYGDDVARMVNDSVSTTQEGMAPESPESPGAEVQEGQPTGEPGFREVFESVRGAVAFRSAENREQAQVVANRLARNAMELGLTRREVRESLAELIPEDAPWAGERDEIIMEAMRNLPAGGDEGTDPGESLARGPEPDSSGIPGASSQPEEGVPAIQDPRAEDSIKALSRRVQMVTEERDDYRDRLTRVEAALEEARSGGIFDWLRNLIDEMGLGFGWAALYLTITHAWWKGTTVGKKILRIRVVMIDQRPLNWWLSFERAGGYAAGFATGLLGFAQIFWDPNRQAIHDKVSETIVIQDGKPPVPGPWIEKGKAQWDRSRSRNTPGGAQKWGVQK